MDSQECSMCGKSGARWKDKDKEGMMFCGEFCQGRSYGILAGNIEKMTLENTDYRRVVATTKHEQLVLMNVTPADGNEVERETHPKTTQFVRIEKGNARILLGGVEVTLGDGGFVMVPPGTEHWIVNVSDGDEPLKLYTIYSPPHHPENEVETRRRFKHVHPRDEGN